MNRIVTIELGGTSYGLCYSLWAYDQICDKYGDVKSCLDRLDYLVETQDRDGLTESYYWLLALLDESYRRRCRNTGDGAEPAVDLPSLESLKNLICPGDFIEIQRKVIAAISLGNAREVGAAPAKNGDGAGT